MYGQQPVYGQPVPPPMPAYGQPPPPMPAYGQPAPPAPMAMPMVQQQPQQQVTTTTTTVQPESADDGKSKNWCCIIIFAILMLSMIVGANSMHDSIDDSIQKSANRDQVYATVNMRSSCDNPQKFDDTAAGKNKGKCVDFKGKWHIKNNIQIRSENGFKDDVIDSRCAKIVVTTEMYAEYERCKNKRNNRECIRGERDCSCHSTREYLKDKNDLKRAFDNGFHTEYGFNFPCRDCIGSKEYDSGDDAVFRQTKGTASVDQLVSEELKKMAIKEQGSEPLSFGYTGAKEICLTNFGGNYYSQHGGFYANKINNENVWDGFNYKNAWTTCSSVRSGDYKMTATCVAPPSDKEVRIIGGLDSDGVRLGGYQPKEGVNKSNKEKILIWETKDINTENKDVILKHQNKERAESKQVIQSKRTGRNVMIILAFVFGLISLFLCLSG